MKPLYPFTEVALYGIALPMGWILAHTHTNREQWAAENIARQNIEYYLPKYLKTIKRGRRIIGHKPEILFPSYIFVRTDGRWRFLLGTFGIFHVVSFGEFPAVVPESAILAIKAMEEDGFVRLPTRESLPFAINQAVRVTDGQFSGFVGLFEGMQAIDRVRILLNGIMGRTVRVHLPLSQLEAV